MQYLLDRHKIVIKVKDLSEKFTIGASLVLPVISPTGEQVSQPSEHKIEVQKKEGKITIAANVHFL